MSDHDPFNDPKLAHPRARELMPEAFFWSCVNELAPFGSDEGSDAYYEWRRWRAGNPNSPLTKCMAWIMDGQLPGYNESL
ncbi:molybdate metabolism regulator, partial [bacterium]|nr:molybdate metabolism regulator [bacterium]